MNAYLRRRGPALALVAVVVTLVALAPRLAAGAPSGAIPALPDQGTAVPTALPPVDTPTAVPTALPPVDTPTPVPTAPAVGNVCPQILRRVPRQAIDAAVANPRSVRGYNKPRDMGKPLGPYNPPRLWLSIMAYSKPYHPFFNSLEYKVGCP